MDSTYTERFGSAVEVSEVLDVDPANHNATIVADLTAADHVRSESFDCVILTQTLQFIYDVPAAIREVHRMLRAGGVLLATVPAVSRVDGAAGVEGDFWRFTHASCTRLFGDVFSLENVRVTAHGNVLAAIAFLTGLAAEELSHDELRESRRALPRAAYDARREAVEHSPLPWPAMVAKGLVTLAALAAVVSTVVGSGSAAETTGQLVTYPAPAGQALSSAYSVRVRPVGGSWTELDEYEVTVDRDTYSKAAIVAFDTSGPVEVEVTKRAGTMRSARVRPRSLGVMSTIGSDGKTATFVLPRPLNVSFEVDGDILHNVHVFASPIEADAPAPGPGVIFFGPGRHAIGGTTSFAFRATRLCISPAAPSSRARSGSSRPAT